MPSLPHPALRILLRASATMLLAGCGATSPDNPLPRITSVSAVDTDSLRVTVVGTGFVNGSVVLVSNQPLPTRFVSNSTLVGAVQIGLQRFFTANVTVQSPGPGGGTSAPAVLNWEIGPTPLPTLDSIAPRTVAVGADSLVLKLWGTGFLRASTVFVPEFFASYAPRTRTPTFMEIVVPKAALAAPAAARPRVSNPGAGGGESNFIVLTVR